MRGVSQGIIVASEGRRGRYFCQLYIERSGLGVLDRPGTIKTWSCGTGETLLHGAL